jgi:hypothetical protein
MKVNVELEKSFFSEVYDILVKEGGAEENMRDSFVSSHLSTSEYPCNEWRFCGYFGFGGKYRRGSNTVDYYLESTTPSRDLLEKQINDHLRMLKIFP